MSQVQLVTSVPNVKLGYYIEVERMNQKEKIDLIANVLMVCDHDDYTYEETVEELIRHFDFKLKEN